MNHFYHSSTRCIDNKISNLRFHDLTPTNITPPQNIKSLLGLNLKFCPTPKLLKINDFQQKIEEFKRSIRIKFEFSKRKKKKDDNKKFNSKLYVPNKDFIPKNGPKHLEDLFEKMDSNIRNSALLQKFNADHKKWTNLNRKNRNLLRKLMNNKDFKIIPSDKNLGPCIMTITQYRNFCLKFLENPASTHYELITEEELQQKISNLRSTLRLLHDTLFIRFRNSIPNSDIIIHDIENKGENIFYGMPKLHKKTMGIRPIISNSNGILSGLSKWVDYHLRPYLLETTTFLRDSDQLLSDLTLIKPLKNFKIITFDVVNMYNEIKTDKAIRIISNYLPKLLLNKFVISGLKLILENNYFRFDNKCYLQKMGTAMGTPVAPTFASLFLAILEIDILKEFSDNIIFLKRYIDDGFLIWNNNGPRSYDDFEQTIKEKSGLDFTHEFHNNHVNFLDLTIYWDNNKFYSRTYEKPLNLHLYIPPHSAHPYSVIKSLIFGRILKYEKQNSKKEDFYYFCRQLFLRLRDRGYKFSSLWKLFKEAFKMLANEKDKEKKKLKQIFLKLPFHPKGLNRKQLENLLQLKELKKICETIDIDKITICHLKPSSLGALLAPTKFKSEIEKLPTVDSPLV